MLAKAPWFCANFVAPYVVFELFDARYGDVFALIASAVPPLLWSFYELAKTRRLDAISMLVVSGIVLTVGATLMGGSARLIQIRDALFQGGVAEVFEQPQVIPVLLQFFAEVVEAFRSFYFLGVLPGPAAPSVRRRDGR